MLPSLLLSLITALPQPSLEARPHPHSLHPLAPQLAIFGRPRRNREEEERKRTQVVRVSTAQLTSENIAGGWFHTLKGTVENRAPNPVVNVVVHYEIVGADGKLADAGSVKVPTELLPPGGQVEFTSSSPKAGGQVRVTLVEWLNADRSYGSFGQRQVFANP